MILTRKPSEAIRIGDNITVTVLGNDSHGEVRIGIDAPDTVKIHRQEVYERIEADKMKEQSNG